MSSKYADDKGEYLKHLTRSKDISEILSRNGGERYLSYRKKWNLASQRKDYYKVPVQLDIDITNVCNMACHHCNAITYGPDMDKKIIKDHIDMELLKKRLKEAIPLGVDSINFGNGSEPLITKNELFELIDLGKELGVTDVFLHTNGLLLEGERAERILSSGVTVLCVSLDAFYEKTFNKIGRKNYSKVVKNINDFRELRDRAGQELPILRVSYLPTIHNYEEVPEFVKYWESRVDKAELQSIFDLDPEKSGIKDTSAFEKMPFDCSDPWKRLPIWPNNTYGVCCQYYSYDAGSKFNLGSLNDFSIEEVWNSEQMQNIRRALEGEGQNKECQECMANTYCLADHG